jgi:predicted nucleic acid-binding protein
VLDTSVLIDVLRSRPEAVAYARSLTEVPACSEVSRIEVITGLRSPERQAAEMLFATIEWVVVDEGIARRAGELGRRFRRSHPGIDAADLAVAATAARLGRSCVTANVKHFPMFPGLQPPY